MKKNSESKAKKIAEAKLKYSDDNNIIFTQTEKICMYNYELNNNTMIMGGSGSGKTRGYVLPNILQCSDNPYSPSIVITDPKAEIIGKVGKYLESKGYVIKVLNLKEQDKSFCFNPFVYIIEKRFEEQISTLVSCIMDSRNDSKEQKTNDPFWDDMSKVLLKSIFYATYEAFPLEEQNMSTVMEMFRWFEIQENDDRYRNPTKLDRFFEKLGDKDGVYEVTDAIVNFYKLYYGKYVEAIGKKSCLELKRKEIKEKISIPLHSSNTKSIDLYRDEIMDLTDEIKKALLLDDRIKDLSNTAIAQIEKYKKERANAYQDVKKPIGVLNFEKYGDVNSNPALRNWEDFRTKCKGKTAQSVTATALAKLAPFDEEQIRRIFSKDEMELDLVGERKTALFIILPPTQKTYNFIANVLYSQLFEQLEYCASVKHKEKQCLPVSVRFILDEFFNTGRIANFENILSYARSFGIGISIILQSLDQIKEMYEKSWGTILDNCSTFLYLGGIKHADTLEYISKLLGKGTYDKKTYSRTKGRQSSTSTSFDKIGRELLDPSEIQRLNKKKCLLFISGYQPYLSQKFNYKTHKNYKYTSDANKNNFYDYELPDRNDRVVTNDAIEDKDNVKNKKNKKEDTARFIKTELITLETNQEEVYKYLKEHVLFMDFEEEDIHKIHESEIENITVLANIVEKEREKAKRARRIEPVKISDEREEVIQAIDEMMSKKENVGFVYPEDFNGEEDEIKGDLDEVFDEIMKHCRGYREEMEKDGFVEGHNYEEDEDEKGQTA